MERSVTASKDLSNFVFRAPTALATIANVRKEESTVAATITRVDMVSWYFENLLKTNTGKKYCYGSTEGEYCHCDFCKMMKADPRKCQNIFSQCKHGYGVSSGGYGSIKCGGGKGHRRK